MTIHRILRLVAGFLVLAGLILSQLVDPKWLWLSAFVGLNLFQSALTDWCPLITILKKMGVPETTRTS